MCCFTVSLNSGGFRDLKFISKWFFFNFNPLNPSAPCKVLSVTFAKERAWCQCSERCLALVKFVFVTVSLDIVDSIPVLVKQKWFACDERSYSPLLEKYRTGHFGVVLILYVSSCQCLPEHDQYKFQFDIKQLTNILGLSQVKF